MAIVIKQTKFTTNTRTSHVFLSDRIIGELLSIAERSTCHNHLDMINRGYAERNEKYKIQITPEGSAVLEFALKTPEKFKQFLPFSKGCLAFLYTASEMMLGHSWLESLNKNTGPGENIWVTTALVNKEMCDNGLLYRDTLKSFFTTSQLDRYGSIVRSSNPNSPMFFGCRNGGCSSNTTVELVKDRLDLLIEFNEWLGKIKDLLVVDSVFQD